MTTKFERAKYWRRLLTMTAFTVIASGWSDRASAFDVTTYHYDNLRTGWNSRETVLTLASVGGATFGVLASVAGDSSVLEPQPLVVTGVTVTGGSFHGSVHDLVYVMGTSDKVYAFDATTGKLILSRRLGKQVPASAHLIASGGSVRSTSVVDLSRHALYVMGRMYENSVVHFRLFSLDLGSLNDKVPSAVVSATSTLEDNSTLDFDPTLVKQRPGLLESNGNIYAAFGGLGETRGVPIHGWLLGWNADTLTPLSSNILTNRHATIPGGCAKGKACFLSSIWMSGAAPAADADGNIYIVTGNSDPLTYGPPVNVQESVVKISGDLTQVLDIFTPSTVNALDKADQDFGSGGVALLPPQGGGIPPLAVAAGKSGIWYLLNQNNLGGFTASGPDHMLASVPAGRCWCVASYFQGADGLGRIVSSGDETVTVWKLHADPVLGLTAESSSPPLPSGQDPSFFTSVSSNGTNANSAIIWALPRPIAKPGVITLYAINPADGSIIGAWPAGRVKQLGHNLNAVPVVANGKVYVTTGPKLTILGPGGDPNYQFAPLLGLATDAPAGQHEVFGWVSKVSTNVITLTTRNGSSVQIDISKATEQAEDTEIGTALDVWGKYNAKGIFVAAGDLRAKEPSALWPPDR